MKNLVKVGLAFGAGMLTTAWIIIKNASEGDTVYEDDTMKVVTASGKGKDNQVVAMITYK